MQGFDYARPRDLQAARALLVEPGAVLLGGGTDLLVTIEEGIARPSLVIDVRHIDGMEGFEWREDGSLWIGAATRIARIAGDSLVSERFASLAMACESVGTPALRNMGTLGGNLCQRPRCSYFRIGFNCFKVGGLECPAAESEGEHQLHAIVGGGPCFAVHPSDPAVALTALDAVIHVVGAAGERRIGVADFFLPPRLDPTRENVLEAGDMIVGVEIPSAASSPRQRYTKLMQREAWDFALVSLATAKRVDGSVRLVLGGVAPGPWRVNQSIEEDVAAGNLGDDDLDILCDRALHDVRPLEKNGYKVAMARALLREGIAFAAA